jgi:hypothetical protein
LINRSGEDSSEGDSSFAAIVAVDGRGSSFVASARGKQISFSVGGNIDPIPARRKHGKSALLPCGPPRFIGGDPGVPDNWVITWSSDGKEHSLRERPISLTDEKAQSWARQAMRDLRFRRKMSNIMSAGGVPLPECQGLSCD